MKQLSDGFGCAHEGVRELIHLGFQRYQPHPALKPWIQCYWITDAVTFAPSVEHLYPDGGSSLVFNIAARDGVVATFAAHQKPRTIAVATPLLGVRFNPTGAYQLLGLPMKELGGETVSPAHLLIPELLSLCERMTDESILRQVKMVDNWMLDRVKNRSPSRSLGELLTAFTASQHGSMQALVSELRVSRRSVERLLKEQTGSTFGQLHVWRRGRRARRLIKLEQAHSLTEIGLACGYYDQSHFIREFKRTTKFTPMEYRKRQRKRIADGEMVIIR